MKGVILRGISSDSSKRVSPLGTTQPKSIEVSPLSPQTLSPETSLTIKSVRRPLSRSVTLTEGKMKSQISQFIEELFHKGSIRKEAVTTRYLKVLVQSLQYDASITEVEQQRNFMLLQLWGAIYLELHDRNTVLIQVIKEQSGDLDEGKAKIKRFFEVFESSLLKARTLSQNIKDAMKLLLCFIDYSIIQDRMISDSQAIATQLATIALLLSVEMLYETIAKYSSPYVL